MNQKVKKFSNSNKSQYQAGESDFIVILDCDEGEIHYKFFAEGAWKHDHKQACVR